MAELLLYNAVNQGVFSSREDNPPNLGLFAISSFVKQKGFSVKLSGNIKFLDREKDLRPLLKDALLVGVSSMTGDPIKNGLEFTRAVKALRPDVKIAWGGYHATLEPEQTLKEKDIDFLIRGWGEEPVVELLDALKFKKDYSRIRGLSYRQDDKVIHNNVASFGDINGYPVYDYDLIDGFKERIKGGEFIYCSSRGCPFTCSFCSVAAFYGGNKPYYTYPLERVFNELEYFQAKYQPSHFFFWDDNFFVDKNRVRQFCGIYKERGCTFSWGSFGRCDFFSGCDGQLLKLLEEVNLKKVYFGAESGSRRILAKVNKKITPEQITHSLMRLKETGISCDYTFMSGLPSEGIDDLKETLRLMKRLRKIKAQTSLRLFNFTPSPKMGLIQECIEAGFKYPQSLNEWSKFEYHSFVAPWASPRHARMLKVLPWLTSFLSEEAVPYRKGRSPLNVALKLLNLSANFRFENNFYALPVEWLALRYFYRRHLGMK